MLVDKPAGWTSHDVVAKLRGITGIKRIGHGGTLDPFATGLLVIGIGTATKELDQFVQGDKAYEATIRLGMTSTTDDPEGELNERHAYKEPDIADVSKVLEKFVGKQEQLPPVYSALKTGGRKAYQRARAGEEVPREPRPVEIKELELVRYEWPELEISTTVSKGTYIRALARDIGEALGTGAFLKDLQRTAVGTRTLEQAHGVAELESGWVRYLEKTP